jgi:hypothetical protein
VEYIYHIVIPKNQATRVNDCFSKLCKTNSKPFTHNLAAKSVYKATHVGACFLNEKELSIFDIVLQLNDPNVFWWKVSEESGRLEDCNDADCFIYLGEKLEYKQLFKKAGFIYLNQNNE